MKILAIDPSVMNSAGWATVELEWTNSKAERKLVKEEWNWGAWEISGFNFQQRCCDLKDYIEMEIGTFDQLVLEWPMFYDSQKGQTAAREGYTINLAGIAMFTAGWFHMPSKQTFLYTAPDWKGQLTKAITARRFYKLFGINQMTVDHNAIDACMMLVHHCRKIKLTSNS